jgi:hypothetical protein
MVMLTPMAWASPPDPVWMGGIYDSRDFDDVVTYLTFSMLGIAALLVVYQAESCTFVPASPTVSNTFEDSLLSPHSPRAPPLA